MQLLEDELLEISCSKVKCSNMTLLELQVPRTAVSKAVSILTGCDTDFRKWFVEWPTNV
jgi:hypothetical protein